MIKLLLKVVPAKVWKALDYSKTILGLLAVIFVVGQTLWPNVGAFSLFAQVLLDRLSEGDTEALLAVAALVVGIVDRIRKIFLALRAFLGSA